MTRKPTRLYRLIEERLDCSLAEFVDERRRPGVRPPASWEAIARDLYQKTGIEISSRGLQAWFAVPAAASTEGGR